MEERESLIDWNEIWDEKETYKEDVKKGAEEQLQEGLHQGPERSAPHHWTNNPRGQSVAALLTLLAYSPQSEG